MKKEYTKRRRRIFFLDAPNAKEVILMGDFNNWDKKTHPMKKNNDGLWTKMTMLLIGRHEYKFLVDGEWWNDPNNDQVCYNEHGTLNNVINVT